MSDEVMFKVRKLLDMLFQGRDFAAWDDEVDRTVQELDEIFTTAGYPSQNVPVED